MSTINDFLAFATGSSPNVLSQSAYAALAARSTGFQTGTAESQQLNKVWRQSSFQAAVAATFVQNVLNIDVIDNGDLVAAVANFTAAVAAVAAENPQPFVNVNTAATMDLGAADSNNIYAVGNNVVSSFGSSANIEQPLYTIFVLNGFRIARGAGMDTPNNADVYTSANDVVFAQYFGSGNWRVIGVMPAGTLGGPVQNIAAGATTDIGSVRTNNVQITGTASISSFGTSGLTTQPVFFIKFANSGATLVNSGALLMPAGQNIVVNAGDSMIAICLGSGNWQVVAYFPTKQYSPFVALASAATVDLGAARSQLIEIDGTTNITSFGNSANTQSPFYFIRYTGLLTVVNSSALQLPGSQNITIRANDVMIAFYTGSGNWQVLSYIPSDGGRLGSINAAATTDIGGLRTPNVLIAGASVNITSFGSSANICAPMFNVSFNGVNTLVNSGSLVLPNGANRTTAAGDSCLAQYQGSGNWIILAYFPATTNGSAFANLASASTTDLGTISSHNVTVTGTSTINSFGSSASLAAPLYYVQFAAGLTVKNSGAIGTPGGADIATNANDWAIVRYLGSGNWRVVDYFQANLSLASYGQDNSGPGSGIRTWRMDTGGYLDQRGDYNSALVGDNQPYTFTFPKPFPSFCNSLVITGKNVGQASNYDGWVDFVSFTTGVGGITGATVVLCTANGNNANLDGFFWMASGG